MNRSRDFVRFHRERTIARKLKMIKPLYCTESYERELKKRGRLSKGKIHCSCKMCKIRYKEEPKASDRRQLSRYPKIK